MKLLRSLPLAWSFVLLLVGSIAVVNVLVWVILLDERRGAISQVIFDNVTQEITKVVRQHRAGLSLQDLKNLPPTAGPNPIGMRIRLLDAEPMRPTGAREAPTLSDKIARELDGRPLHDVYVRLATNDEGWIKEVPFKAPTPVAVAVEKAANGQSLIVELAGPPLPAFSMFLFGLALVYATVVCSVAVMLVRRITGPLSALADGVVSLGQNPVFQPIPERGVAEVRQVARAFNSMSQQVSGLVQRQRTTLWALSHDLRTPLTAMRLKIELLNDDEDRKALLPAWYEMEKLVEDALWLARAGTRQSPTQVIFVPALVDEALALAMSAQTLNHEVQVIHEEESLSVKVDSNEAKRALCNLLENAIRYGAAPLQLRTRSDQAGFVMFEITDAGKGYPAEILESQGQAFQRGDQARGSQGFGLGLAIVKAIAEGHGGRLTLSNKQADGACARLYLPGN